MITVPRIKQKYVVQPVEGDGVFLLGETENHILEGASICAVVPLMDGTRTWDEIRTAVAGEVDPDQAAGAFEVLVNSGHVEQASHAMPAELQVFWSEFGIGAEAARRMVAGCNIHLLSSGGVDRSAFDAAIAAFGFPQDHSAPPGLTIVATDDYQSPEIEAVNDRALAHGTPWILVKPDGLLPLVGPFFLPGRTACWACLESRLKHNREVESYVRRRAGRASPFETTRMRVPLAQMQSISMVLMQACRWLATGRNETLESRITELNIVNGEQSHHHVTRRPQCPACGAPEVARVAGRPIEFTDQTLTAKGENGFRVEAPEATFYRYAQHVSHLTGVVKHITQSQWNATGPVRTYFAGHNFALKSDGIYFIKDGLRSSSSGKGKTDAQARTSALCEALERYSGLPHEGVEIREASFRDLGPDAVDPARISLFSARQYRERQKWLEMGERFQVVPLPFDPDARISWSPVWSHSKKRRKWIPTSQVYYGHSDGDDKFFCWGDSNGNAAGSSIEDATLQGFLELVERDAVAIWWYNRIRRPAVDLDTLNDPYIDEMRAFYAGFGREFWALDLTSDLGIPCFAAITRRTDAQVEDIVIGFGAHLDARVGIMRALTEMNQFIPALLTMNEDGSTRYGFDDPASLRWWTTGKLRDNMHLAPEKGPARALQELPGAPTGQVMQHLERCFGVVEEKGMEVLILDQTRPDIGLHVVKVIVPGMRHFWARFAPGRLFDVPVEMGWLPKSLAEDQLNPIPMFV